MDTSRGELLALRDVRASYGNVEILHGVSLSAAAGESLSVLGVNGAGKTTLLRAIAGIMVRRQGEIRFDGTPIGQMPAHRIVTSGISLVPEGRHLFPTLSVQENIDAGAIPLQLRHEARLIGETRQQVFELFPRLAERRNQLAKTLSGGEQQMLAIGRALMARPRLLLLDEPSVGLAPKVIEDLFEVFQRLKKTGLSILLAEQNVQLALDLADRAVLLDLGEVKLTGSAAELRNDDTVRQIYLGGA